MGAKSVDISELQPMSQSKFAELAGVSRKQVTLWKSKGYLKILDDGKVDAETSARVLISRGLGTFNTVTIPEQTVTPPEPESEERNPVTLTPEETAERLVLSDKFKLLPYAEAEALKENYQALLTRLKYEKEAGTLVLKAQIEKLFTERWAAERNAWENWPSKVAGKLAAELGIDQITLRVALEELVEEFLKSRVSRAENARVRH